jgi:hypothetical protein
MKFHRLILRYSIEQRDLQNLIVFLLHQKRIQTTVLDARSLTIKCILNVLLPIVLTRGKRHVYACIRHNETSLKNITVKKFSELFRTEGSLQWIPAPRQLYLSANIHIVSYEC